MALRMTGPSEAVACAGFPDILLDAMPNCHHCNAFILFGGATDETGRYCNQRCRSAGKAGSSSLQIPQETLDKLVADIHQSTCPRCQGRGPVDIHKAHKVWSALFWTSWSSNPEMSCKPCAVKRQLGATLFSVTLGWWGFPFGLLMTPLQIIRNVAEMVSGPSASQPSLLLRQHVALQAAVNASGADQGSKTPGTARTTMPPPLPSESIHHRQV